MNYEENIMKINFSKVIRYVLLLTPVPEGYAIYLAMEVMNWHPFFRVVAAVIVASAGFWGVMIMNDLSEYNATLHKGEDKEIGTLPTWKAMMVLGVWFSGVTILTVFLDVFPVLQVWAPLGIVVVGFSAAFLASLRNLHETRTQEREAYRQKLENKKEEDAAEKKAERKERKELEQRERKERKEREQAIAKKKQEIGARMEQSGIRKQGKNGGKLNDATLLLYWSMDPTLTSGQMRNRLIEDGVVDDVSRQAIDQRTKKMIEKGLIIKTASGEVREVIFETASQPGAES